MPRLTDETARSRRDEIVRATIRVMREKGVSATSIADISAASGLSAGSIYSHFPGKSDIVARAAREAIGERARLLEASMTAAAEARAPRPPRDVVAEMVQAFDDDEIPASLVLQMWGEAVVDPAIRAVFDESIAGVRRVLEPHARAWLERAGEKASAAAVRSLVGGMIAISQAYIVRIALLGPVTWQAHTAQIDLAMALDQRDALHV